MPPDTAVQGLVFIVPYKDARKLRHIIVVDDYLRLSAGLKVYSPDMDLNGGDGDGALLYAAAAGAIRCAALLLDRGADVNLANREGLTPLMAAVIDSQPIVARLLIKRSANVHARTNIGASALDILACSRKRSEARNACARILLAAGARLPGALNTRHRSPDIQGVIDEFESRAVAGE